MIEIPLSGDNEKFEVLIENKRYTIEIIYNKRHNKPIFYLFDEEESPIIFGFPLHGGVPILQQFRARNVPSGNLFFWENERKLIYEEERIL